MIPIHTLIILNFLDIIFINYIDKTTNLQYKNTKKVKNKNKNKKPYSISQRINYVKQDLAFSSKLFEGERAKGY